jgi:hypothetical protein
LVVVYGELDKRFINVMTSDTSARHRGGETVADLRKRHHADELPYYPVPTKPIGS